MNTVEEIEVLNLPRSEKIKLLHILIHDLSGEFEGIEKTEGICGGAARIVNTRIPVWVLENARRRGVTEAGLLQDYPTISAQDLANTWNYVRSNTAEIDEQIRLNEED